MNLNPQISIIIPIYNVERFLHRCVNGILSQEFTDYEILLIDDGSHDNSGNICDEYATRYPFIKVLHKCNGGVSSARNLGLDHAVGKYVLFIDADDELASGALTAFDMTIKRWSCADVIQGGVITIGGNKGFYVNSDWAEFESGSECVANFLLHMTPWGVWNKLFKREIIEKNHVRFVNGIIMGEDQLFMYEFQFYAHSYAICPVDTYLYHVDNESSIMHIADKTETYCSEIRVAEEIVKKLPKNASDLLFRFTCRFLEYDNYKHNIDKCENKYKVKTVIKKIFLRVKKTNSPYWSKFMFWYLTLPDIISQSRWVNSLYYRIIRCLR